MENHRELIEKFHEDAKNQVLKEFQNNETIEPKVILLLLNHDDKPVYFTQTVPTMLLDDDPDGTVIEEQEKDITKLITSLEVNGYDVLSLFRVEYDQMGRVYAYLKKGANLKEKQTFEYQLLKESSFVQADGKLVTGDWILDQLGS